MSIRSPVFADHKPAERPGSLFGAAIGTPTGGFWHRLAVSPPRTPPTEASRYAQLPPEFHLDAGPAAVPTAGQLDSVFPSWVHDFSDAVLVTFAESADVVTLRAAPRLECANVVQPTMVRADAVAWRPMACEATGTRGHLFTLSCGGKQTCRIEVSLAGDGDEIGRVVVVQPEYSPVAIAARTAAPSSLLIFDDVRARTESLHALRHTLVTSGDTGYVPTQELVATGALDRLVLATDHSPEAAVARRHWKTLKLLLAALSAATADCVDAYAHSELRRVNQCVVGSDAWRRAI
jgi:hypothetical protein